MVCEAPCSWELTGAGFLLPAFSGHRPSLPGDRNQAKCLGNI